MPYLSNDGRYVSFASQAFNLAPGDDSNMSDVFVKDRLTRKLTLASASAAGIIGNRYSVGTAPITADDRQIVFQSLANNLVSNDINNSDDICYKDLLTRVPTPVSVSTTGLFHNRTSNSPSMTADARNVSFHTAANDLSAGDTNALDDVYLNDRQSGAVTRVIVGPAGVQANGASSLSSTSANGRFIVNQSLATNLLPGDSNGQADVFVKDLSNGAIERVSTSAAGAQFSGGDCVSASISVDGRYVGFVCGQSNLVAGDSNGLADAFVKDRQTGSIRRLSISAVGAGANAASSSGAQALSSTGFMVFSSAADNPATAFGSIDPPPRSARQQPPAASASVPISV